MSQVLQCTQFEALIFRRFSILLDHFVDGGGAKILAGISILGNACEAAGLVFEDALKVLQDCSHHAAINANSGAGRRRSERAAQVHDHVGYFICRRKSF
jgi:hypothetical protein